jgi:tetratricopeptide (TPR) repeat protein
VPPPPRRPSSSGRSGRPDRSARPDRPQKPAGPAPTGGGRAPERPRRPPRPPGSDDRPQRPRVPEPELPDDIDVRSLDRATRAGLRSLPEDLAERIAQHLVAAGRALDDDPEAAAAHARFARQLAPRLAVVREATGITAYYCGDYATALAELRAVRRMTGDPSYLPMMADCERGLGRPERALDLIADPLAARLDAVGRVELSIVASGARRDLGQTSAAVLALQGPALDSTAVEPWTVRLWYAYAAALLDAGRIDDARQWFTSVAAIDEDEETDAEERLAELDAR